MSSFEYFSGMIFKGSAIGSVSKGYASKKHTKGLWFGRHYGWIDIEMGSMACIVGNMVSHVCTRKKNQ